MVTGRRVRGALVNHHLSFLPLNLMAPEFYPFFKKTHTVDCEKSQK